MKYIVKFSYDRLPMNLKSKLGNEFVGTFDSKQEAEMFVFNLVGFEILNNAEGKICTISPIITPERAIEK